MELLEKSFTTASQICCSLVDWRWTYCNTTGGRESKWRRSKISNGGNVENEENMGRSLTMCFEKKINKASSAGVWCWKLK